MHATARPLVIPFREITLATLPEVGGKNASLGEMICTLKTAGVRVPDGFARVGRGVPRASSPESSGRVGAGAARIGSTSKTSRRSPRPLGDPGAHLRGWSFRRRSRPRSFRRTARSRGSTEKKRRTSRFAPARRPRTCPRPRSPASRTPTSISAAPRRCDGRPGVHGLACSPIGRSSTGSSRAFPTATCCCRSASRRWSAATAPAPA